MRRIFISAGHTNRVGKDDVGAESTYLNKPIYEGVEAAKFVEALVAQLKTSGLDIVVDSYSNALAGTIKAFKDVVKPGDVVIEYHFNCGGASGTESFVADKNTYIERTAATLLSVATSKALKIKIRGGGPKTESESARKKLGLMRLPCEVILHELCFIDVDMKSYFYNFVELLKEHQKAIVEIAKL